MGLKSWFNSRHSAVQAALILGLFGLVGGVAAAVINTELGKSGSPGSVAATNPRSTSIPSTSIGTPGTSPPSAAPTPTPSPTCQAKLHITRPIEDAIIPNGLKAAPITGTVCGLGSNSGWLFDFDPDDGYYYDDYTGSTPTPAVQPSQQGVWDFPNSPIGDPGDQNKRYTITLVLASRSCDKRLHSEAPIDGDYKLRAFPSGCTVIQKVDVYVTNPQS